MAVTAKKANKPAKAPAKKTTAKKTPAKKAPAKKAAAKKTVAKKAPAKKAAAKKPAAPKAQVKSGTMDFVGEMMKQAQAFQKSIVLPEGTEPSTVKAASKIVSEKIEKKVILLGVPAEVEKVAQSVKANLKGIDIVNPAASAWIDDFAKSYFELRQGKINKKTGLPDIPDVSTAKAFLLSDPLSFGAMMVNSKTAQKSTHYLQILKASVQKAVKLFLMNLLFTIILKNFGQQLDLVLVGDSL